MPMLMRLKVAPGRAATGASPQLPRRLAGRPQVVELDRVLVGVHALPEARVPVRAQLPVGGEALERLALERARLADVVEDARLEAEEAAVDPVVRARLLGEADDAVAVEQRDAEL